MPIGFDRYVPDNASIAEFLLSDQLRDAVRQGAEDVAQTANNSEDTPSKVRGTFFREPGPPVVVTRNGNPRLSERVWSHHSAAAALEFGSGRRRERKPQGGSSPQFRMLGKAGARHADRLGEVDD